MNDNWNFKISSGNFSGSLVKTAAAPAPAAGAAPAAGQAPAPAAGTPAGPPSQVAVSLQAAATFLEDLTKDIAALKGIHDKQPTLLTAVMPFADLAKTLVSGGLDINATLKKVNNGQKMAASLMLAAKNPNAVKAAQEAADKVIAAYDAFETNFGFFGGFKSAGEFDKFVAKPLEQLRGTLKQAIGEIKKAAGK